MPNTSQNAQNRPILLVLIKSVQNDDILVPVHLSIQYISAVPVSTVQYRPP